MNTQIAARLTKFISDFERHEMFLRNEAQLKNPAHPRARPRSETMLSAYVSLSCGRFEGFLQEVFYATAAEVKTLVTLSQDARIPDVNRFHESNCYGFVDWINRAKGLDQNLKLLKLRTYCEVIARGEIFPESFQYTGSNPNAATLVSMFARFGIKNVMQTISTKYVDSLGRRLPKALIEQKLDNFVQRRHQAAHQGRVVGMTRIDAKDDHVFVGALAVAVTRVLDDYLKRF